MTNDQNEFEELLASLADYKDAIRRRFVFVCSFLLISALLVVLIVTMIVFRPSIYSQFTSENPDSADYHVPTGVQAPLNPSFGNAELFDLDERIRDAGKGIKHPTIRNAFSALREILAIYRKQFQEGNHGSFEFEVRIQTLESESDGMDWNYGEHVEALDKVREYASEHLRPGMDDSARSALRLIISTVDRAKQLHSESPKARTFLVKPTSGE